MDFNRWYLLVGGLLLLMVVLGRRLERLPITTAMVYLAIGYALGEFGWLRFDLKQHQPWLEHLSELAVIISLFSAGLKMREPLTSPLWRLPTLLAFVSMSVTVGLLAALGVYVLDLSWGAAVILGAVLAPTDPVLASDVQVKHAKDNDRVRFSLTGEAGLNDGTAFPFVMLGLGLLELHPLGAMAGRWWARDVFWAIGAGLVLGALLGMAVARLIVYLRARHAEAKGLDDFLGMGLIAVAYGVSHLIGAYGFLAVFAAGLALRLVERWYSPSDESAQPATPIEHDAEESEEAEGCAEEAPSRMAATVLFFNEHLERIAELTLVIITGILLSVQPLRWSMVLIAGALFFVIRPASVLPVTLALGVPRRESLLMAWFGVRGIGSLYYLFYALGKGIETDLAQQLLTVTVGVITLSMLLHGTSVTPLMKWYEKVRGENGA